MLFRVVAKWLLWVMLFRVVARALLGGYYSGTRFRVVVLDWCLLGRSYSVFFVVATVLLSGCKCCDDSLTK